MQSSWFSSLHFERTTNLLRSSKLEQCWGLRGEQAPECASRSNHEQKRVKEGELLVCNFYLFRLKCIYYHSTIIFRLQNELLWLGVLFSEESSGSLTFSLLHFSVRWAKLAQKLEKEARWTDFGNEAASNREANRRKISTLPTKPGRWIESGIEEWDWRSYYVNPIFAQWYLVGLSPASLVGRL